MAEPVVVAPLPEPDTPSTVLPASAPASNKKRKAKGKGTAPTATSGFGAGNAAFQPPTGGLAAGVVYQPAAGGLGMGAVPQQAPVGADGAFQPASTPHLAAGAGFQQAGQAPNAVVQSVQHQMKENQQHLPQQTSVPTEQKSQGGQALATETRKVAYMGLVGSFPFNSFLSGVLSCIGTAVLEFLLFASAFK